MISKKNALLILNTALKTGSQYAEIYDEESTAKVVALSYKRVENLSTNVSSGIGLRLIKDGKEVYGYTSDVSMKSLLNLATNLSLAFEGEQIVEVKEFKAKRRKLINKIEKPFMDEDVSKVIARLKEAEKAGYQVSDSIVNMSIGIVNTVQNVLVLNFDGTMAKDTRSNIRARVLAVAKNKDGFYGESASAPGFMGGYEKLDDIDFVKTAKEEAEKAIEKSNASDSPSGTMQVVIGNAFGGTLFHEACGHPLEADAIAHNRSTFVGKIGQKIASDVVTAIDDGTIDGAWGSLNFDDEGEVTTKNVLIKDGVLQNYMVDGFNGKKLGMKSTGASRRESYRYSPTSRMTNTYIAAGKSTFDEIISSVKYGIYCKSFKGGQVDPSTNNFNFSSDEVYMIRDGKLAEIVKPVVLVGYGYDILKKIDMVGNDLKLAAGMCGAGSGQLPVQVGQPTVRISGIIVGGTSKEENI